MLFHTIGVYNWTAETWVDALRENKIDLIVDVRRFRMLRGPKYVWANAARLEELLKRAGIGYLYAPDWAPTPDMLKREHTRDIEQFGAVRSREGLSDDYRRDFAKLLETHPVVLLLSQIEEQFPHAERPCLLCVEHEASACHRGLIANELGGAKHIERA